VIELRSVWNAAGYEATRLRTRRSTFGVAALAMFGSALVTLPAARTAVDSGYPQAHVAWVVAGGGAAAILPSTVAVLAAAWIGATYTRLPRRGAGLLGKLLVALCVGLWFASATRIAAYLTALGGFALARGSSAAEHVSLGLALALPTPVELAFGAFGGAMGVLCAPLLRLRVLAAPCAWLLTALIVSLTPGSHSPYTRDVVVGMIRLGLPVEKVALALPEVVVMSLMLASLITLARRRVD